MTFALFATLVLAASAAIAAPQFSPPPAGLGSPLSGKRTCAIKQTLTVPANQTVLTNPTTSASFVLLGVGVQNYTCSTAGTYASIGAVADLYDLSCLSAVPAAFNAIQDQAFAVWNASKSTAVPRLGASANGCNPLMGAHYFVTSPSGTGLSPVWDFRGASAKGNPNAFVLAAKVGDLPAPTGSQDVDWLQLKNVTGGLATSIYRMNTKGGQPPASCTAGSAPISVKYTSKYWLYGSSITV
ncbi:hypothetical protein HYPSUDRAFT_163219 [Hypholoma sublateritium FD-334 SS-4]|uniref:Malate dehydrogenase n=1 Tax=Hypholoma sublateritium (strain FD-334 SS-4) TaxID=945553 RepID=A0A0D2MIQ9_HYPSF|nr:hypothetical protein HYPSUDRAFT_163219 [Hypholoma sublateritium FD-334 SS-4]